jgi:hypothetical protein
MKDSAEFKVGKHTYLQPDVEAAGSMYHSGMTSNDRCGKGCLLYGFCNRTETIIPDVFYLDPDVFKNKERAEELARRLRDAGYLSDGNGHV